MRTIVIILISVIIIAIWTSFFLYSDRHIDILYLLSRKLQSFLDLYGIEFISNDAFRIGTQNGTTMTHDTNEMSLPQLFINSQKSVVQILGSHSSGIGSNTRLGSGFIYDNNAHIITNYHVTAGTTNLNIVFLDGSMYGAKVIGSDTLTDLTVLYAENVPKDKLIPLPLGNSTKSRVGEEVAAIGNPFGLSGSITSGIISGMGRILPTHDQDSGSIYSIADVLQTDAPINPGNSGGPLLNMEGEVIGITSAIISSTGEFSGIGFAVTSNLVNKVIPSLITKGYFKHPWLGVSGINITPEIASRVGLSKPRGFLVVDVISGSPAEKAGIRGGSKSINSSDKNPRLRGDIITGIDDKVVRKIDDILLYLQKYKAVNDTVRLTVFRDKLSRQINITLEAVPNSQESV
jgi:serine protease Do